MAGRGENPERGSQEKVKPIPELKIVGKGGYILVRAGFVREIRGLTGGS